LAGKHTNITLFCLWKTHLGRLPMMIRGTLALNWNTWRLSRRHRPGAMGTAYTTICSTEPFCAQLSMTCRMNAGWMNSDARRPGSVPTLRPVKPSWERERGHQWRGE
jgi:hypothetical protein